MASKSPFPGLNGSQKPQASGGSETAKPSETAATVVDAQTLADESLKLASSHNREREAESCTFEAWPTVPKWRGWRFRFKTYVAGASGWRPKAAFVWITNTEKAKTMEELEDDEGFESLNAKIAAGLLEIVTGEFQRRLMLKMETAALHEVRMINGRQIYWLMLQAFQISEQEGALYEIEDLLAAQLKGDSLRGFLTDWETTLLYMKDRPHTRRAVLI